MKKLVRISTLILLLSPAVSCVSPFLLRSPLERPPVDVGRLYAGKGAKVAVKVADGRPKDSILGGGIVGPQGEQGKGIFLGYVTEKPDELVGFMEAAAKETATSLGLDEGPPVTLEMLVKEFRIEMYRYSGFSPMNCIGYGVIETTLRSADGDPIKSKVSKVTYYENTTPVGSMREVGKEAVSRIYLQAAWEATASILKEQYPSTADPAGVSRLLKAIDTTKDEVVGREIVFWLGLTGSGDPAVKDKVLALFRSSEQKRVRQAAAEAIGLLGIREAEEEISGVLSGARKVSEWDNEDAEECWYLLKALSLLGVEDLSSRIPAKVDKGRSKLVTLVNFMKSGQVPTPTPKEEQDLAKARTKVK